MVNCTDTVHGTMAHTPYAAGDFLWQIPWRFGVAVPSPGKPPSDSTMFTTANQHATADATGRATIEKKGAGPFFADANDPTSGYHDPTGTRMNYDELVGRAAEPHESSLPTDDAEGYAWSVVEVCDQLSSRDLGDWRRQDELVRKYARGALRHATVLPPAAELHLLEHVGAVPTDYLREFATRWLGVLGRLERALEPKFDEADMPLLNVPVAGADLPAGVAEEDVQDPVVRQRYAQAVAENRAHAERYAGHVEARRLLSRYRPAAHRFLVASYAPEPDRATELDELLAEHGVAEDWAAAVRAALRRERPG
jgi:hypothetical protein